jgi:hypothetical protein
MRDVLVALTESRMSVTRDDASSVWTTPATRGAQRSVQVSSAAAVAAAARSSSPAPATLGAREYSLGRPSRRARRRPYPFPDRRPSIDPSRHVTSSSQPVSERPLNSDVAVNPLIRPDRRNFAELSDNFRDHAVAAGFCRAGHINAGL